MENPSSSVHETPEIPSVTPSIDGVEHENHVITPAVLEQAGAEEKADISEEQVKSTLEAVATTGKFWLDWEKLKEMLSCWLEKVCAAESKDVLAFDSLVQVDQQETEQVTQENEADTEEINKSDEDRKTQENGSDQQETEQVTRENESDTEELIKPDEDSKTDSDGLETEPEGDNSGVDSEGTISEADSNQAVLGSDVSETEVPATVPNSPPVIEEANKLSKTTPLSPPVIAESISFQFPRPSKSTTPLKNSAVEMVDENKENNMEMMMNNENGESKGVEVKKKKMKVEIDEENLKDGSMKQLVKMVKELSVKSSNRTGLQILPGNKENNMEMMMNNENGENKGEEGVKRKKMKVEIDEENLSMRQLVNMVKELSIKSRNRTALQILPGIN